MASSPYIKARMKNYLPEPEIREILQTMADDIVYNTKPGYSIDSETYPDNKVPFIETHLNYLKKNPHVDPEQYLGNLRIMLKVR